MTLREPTPSTTNDTLTAFLRTLAGANKRPATITGYRGVLFQFAHFLVETDCTISTPADVRRGDIAEHLAHLAERGINGSFRARKLAAIRE
jgi:site-specific recombinase XerD